MYSRQNRNTTLRFVHFVDRNVTAIAEVVNALKEIKYPTLVFKFIIDQHKPGSGGGAGNSRSAQAPTGSKQGGGVAYANGAETKKGGALSQKEKFDPYAMKNASGATYFLTKKMTVSAITVDRLKELQTKGIVCSEKEDFSFANTRKKSVSGRLHTLTGTGEPYYMDLEKERKRHHKVGDVVVTNSVPSNLTNVTTILHAIIPDDSSAIEAEGPLKNSYMSNLGVCTENILEKAEKCGLESLATAILGSGKNALLIIVYLCISN